MNILLFPFRLVWGLISLVFNLTGRLIGITLGLVTMVIGFILTITIVGAAIGIPLLILGFLLMIRSLFR